MLPLTAELDKVMYAWPAISVRTSTVEKLYTALKNGGFNFNDEDLKVVMDTFEEVAKHSHDEGYSECCEG